MKNSHSKARNTLEKANAALIEIRKTDLVIVDYYVTPDRIEYHCSLSEDSFVCERNILFMFDNDVIEEAVCEQVLEDYYRTNIRLTNGATLIVYTHETVPVDDWKQYMEFNKVCNRCNSATDCAKCPIMEWKLTH